MPPVWRPDSYPEAPGSRCGYALIRRSQDRETGGAISDRDTFFHPVCHSQIQANSIHMSVPSISMVTLDQEERIKRAFSCRCEWCGKSYPGSRLELHLLPERPSGQATPDPEKRLLLLCIPCHRDLHALSLSYPFQIQLVRFRPKSLRREIREILEYIPAPYVAPGEFDIPQIYEDCFSLRSLDLFRAGG